MSTEAQQMQQAATQTIIDSATSGIKKTEIGTMRDTKFDMADMIKAAEFAQKQQAAQAGMFPGQFLHPNYYGDCGR